MQVGIFIEKIVVSSPHYLDGKRYQIIDIHYKGVGIINIQTPEGNRQTHHRIAPSSALMQ